MNNKRDQAGRFKAGQSGNPVGRPRTHHGVDAAFFKALQEKVTVSEQGQRRRKRKLDVAATQVANKGASGDLKAVKLAIDSLRKSEERAAIEASRSPVMTCSDHEIAARVVERIRQIILAEQIIPSEEPEDVDEA